MEIGEKIDNIKRFSPPEGSLNMYYGAIGSGKTYNATADIIDLLKAGQVVYCSWPVALDEYFDDRESLFLSIVNFILHRKFYFRIHVKENFHYFDQVNWKLYDSQGQLTKSWDRQADFMEWLNSLSFCHIFVDEAYRLFDSYEKTNMSMTKRVFALETRHNFRHINILAQRPTSIQVSQRSQVNRFYKCLKLATWPWIRFGRFEYQDMTGETVDESQDPVSKKTYWASNKIFNAYNSYYLGKPPSQYPSYETFFLTWKERFIVLIKNFKGLFSRYNERKAPILPTVETVLEQDEIPF